MLIDALVVLSVTLRYVLDAMKLVCAPSVRYEGITNLTTGPSFFVQFSLQRDVG